MGSRKSTFWPIVLFCRILAFSFLFSSLTTAASNLSIDDQQVEYSLLPHLPSKPSLEDIFIEKLHSEIEKRIQDPTLFISGLCKATGMSHSQLYRKLKALTDQTPVQFIRTYRLHKAENLLQQTQLNVSEVAYQVGFNDPNYFSRTYIQEYGHPPSERRK